MLLGRIRIITCVVLERGRLGVGTFLAILHLFKHVQGNRIRIFGRGFGGRLTQRHGVRKGITPLARKAVFPRHFCAKHFEIMNCRYLQREHVRKTCSDRTPRKLYWSRTRHSSVPGYIGTGVDGLGQRFDFLVDSQTQKVTESHVDIVDRQLSAAIAIKNGMA